MRTDSPSSETELLNRAKSIAGLTLGELATELNISVPPDLKRNKGWVGQLLEIALGAKAGSKPEQDFSHLGIELKTIPIDAQGYPLETTFVSLAPLVQNSGVNWAHSHVKHKLSKVLWIPVQGERRIPLAERYIGAPVLWRPDEEQPAPKVSGGKEKLSKLCRWAFIYARNLRPKFCKIILLLDCIF